MYSRDFREKAWEQLRTHYWPLFVIWLIAAAIFGSNAALVGLALTGPVMIGVNRYMLIVIREDKEDSDVLISAFKGNFIDYILTYLMMIVYVFLWTLLLIIPGIIKALSYSMTFFILADNPDLKPRDALEESERLMDGHKWRLFKLYLSFIGWFILSALTAGIGYLFLQPYLQLSIANFYEDLKGQNRS
jgi:uncharacterized membrane protein